MSEVFANGMNVNISIQPETANDNAPIQITVLPPAEGPKGEPGFSPKASVKKTDTGAVITVEDEKGVTSAVIENGKDGKDGAPGADGFSPKAKVIKTANGATVEITDKNGTTSAEIKNGADGEPGYTPQKGKDYFDGAPGEAGKSAYEIARENGFDGTEEEWLDYLRADSDKLMLIQLYEVEQNGEKYLRHNYTVQEIKDAVVGNKIVLMRDPMGKVYYYSVEETIAGGSYLYFYTTGEYVFDLGIMYDVIVVHSDGTAVRPYIDGKKGEPMRTPNPRSLKIKYGKREISYDGNVDRNIEIADNVLVVKLSHDENYNFVTDKTQAEVRQAVADGKAVIMLDVDVGTTLLYMGEGTIDGEQCPFFVSPLSEIGMTSLLTNIVYLKKSGEVVYTTDAPINALTIKTANGTETFDGSVAKTIDLSNLGSGGSGGTVSSPTDEEVLTALAENDLIMAVVDTEGGILADENGTIIEW